nr:hypothetical protein [Tanacetum cinerariifolium]
VVDVALAMAEEDEVAGLHFGFGYALGRAKHGPRAVLEADAVHLFIYLRYEARAIGAAARAGAIAVRRANPVNYGLEQALILGLG